MEKIKYDKIVNVRLNADDLNVITENAKKQRMPISTYIRVELTKDLTTA